MPSIVREREQKEGHYMDARGMGSRIFDSNNPQSHATQPPGCLRDHMRYAAAKLISIGLGKRKTEEASGDRDVVG